METLDLEAMPVEHESTFGDEACPQWVKDSLKMYVEHGIETGDCLRAVLSNDLQGAFSRADVNTARQMAAIVGFIYRHLPSNLRGSYEVVDEYIAGRIRQRRAAKAGQ